ncbi:MAG: sigma-54-dependent Fis family transcriptional regulator [Bacteroidetes bacterium]|jgi:DNA-binding NtrC family response regulator|nr:sigma-54-dependent Fis family transcriptional regulator [Bacteroidota bacterium]MBK9525725.1 sigma-54-dependent Fis family transcriptional regulator [Bacteroidota bacterium]MBK9540713.1 sigma-54-dependent Fis family transcriptional regulator [Bacteroidota bacterium]MBL0257522.1 sigma-54-dependent Fis family transcriptional regulator [Bacteroidota bacterium]MBP6650567.1 sigma-54-dependent Fis family transcriptional regulator [Bacteroidia bacterium]
MATTKIFVVEDDQFLGNLIKKSLEKLDFAEVTHFLSPEECMNHLHENPDIVTIDYLLPGMNGIELMEKIKNYNQDIQCIVVSGQEKLDVVIETYQKGAVDYIIKNDNALVNLENSVKNLCKTVKLKQENETLKDQVIDRNKYTSILGNSGPVFRVLRLIQKVEKSNIMVLVTGQSGTGKELVAKSIHYNSPRARKPFVTVNMGAIPADLIESELFGHEKGAFTDARDKRIGKFEEANEGTIFLDEIGEMDLSLQTKLLRVLQEKEVTRIGSNKSIKLDVRVIAATNRNLAHEVKEGNFREDLFYRLQGFLIQLPPLYERGDDVILLSKTFLSDFCKENKMPQVSLSKEAAKFLMDYKWPGNIRELKAVIERAAIMSENNVITPEDLVFANS